MAYIRFTTMTSYAAFSMQHKM